MLIFQVCIVFVIMSTIGDKLKHWPILCSTFHSNKKLFYILVSLCFFLSSLIVQFINSFVRPFIHQVMQPFIHDCE